MTERIREFLKNRNEDGPCLVVDLDVVRENYLAFSRALPDSKVFYAVKANPAPDILRLLASLGSSFDVASVNEARDVLAAGASTAFPTATRSRRRSTSRRHSRSA
jgi:ornithine decarboxylase